MISSRRWRTCRAIGQVIPLAAQHLRFRGSAVDGGQENPIRAAPECGGDGPPMRSRFPAIYAGEAIPANGQSTGVLFLGPVRSSVVLQFPKIRQSLDAPKHELREVSND